MRIPAMAMLSLLLPCLPGSAAAPAPGRSAILNLPLAFEQNRGQSDASVRFVAHDLSGAGYTLSLTEDGAVFEAGSAAVHMKVAGARRARISGVDPLPGKVNYFIGNDPNKWVAGAPTYARVAYEQIYPGVDLFFYGSRGQLEYDFVVAPGADSSQIALEFSGAEPNLDGDGNLEVAFNGTHVKFRKPAVYQPAAGEKTAVAGRYRMDGGRVRFELGGYDRSRGLVIDPVLEYLTYLGSGGQTYVGAQTICPNCVGQGVAADPSGNLYITGYTTDTHFSLQNPYQSTYKAGSNGTVFVAEINPTASKLVYSTYLGGSAYDRGSAIAVDAAGAAYVAGQAWSSDFPVVNAYQKLCAPQPAGPNNSLISSCSSSSNAFLTKLAPGGGSLVYSTFLGGNNTDYANAVAVDSQGRAYVAGTANGVCDSSHLYWCFPETGNALQPQSLFNTSLNPHAANPDAAFVAVLDPTGSTLLYSTLFGDKNPSANANNTGVFGSGVAVDASGNFYLSGHGQDPALQTTQGAFQAAGTNLQTNGGLVWRGFVAKFSPVTGAGTGATLMYSTYLGGVSTSNMGGEYIAGIAADSAGNAYVSGYTRSPDFPVTAGANFTVECGTSTYECQNTGFLTKLNPSGTGPVWSTLVGPSTNSIGGTVSVIGPPRLDSNGNVYITGEAFPTYPAVNPIQTSPQTSNGGTFVTRYDPTGSTITFSTIFYSPSGGQVNPGGLDADTNGNIYVGGGPNASDLQETSGVFQPGCAGCAFLAKIQAPAQPPIITQVVNGASYQPGIESGSWVQINGTNLSNTNPGRTWKGTEIFNGNLPVSLDNTSVTIDGKPAFVYYISPTQINVQAPTDSTTGPVNVVVTNNGNVSGPFSAQMSTYAPAFFPYTGTSYAIATDATTYALLGNPSAIQGTVPATPNQVLILWGTGFGPTSPATAAGVVVANAANAATLPTVTVGGVPAKVIGVALSPGSVGLYQVAIQLAGNTPSGIVGVQASVGQVTSPAGVSLFVAAQ